MHSVARGSCPQILLRNPDRHACDRAIRRVASLMVVIPNEVRDLTLGTADHTKNTVGDLRSDLELLLFAQDDILVER